MSTNESGKHEDRTWSCALVPTKLSRDIERLLAKKKDSLPDTILIERCLKTLNLELKHNELSKKPKI